MKWSNLLTSCLINLFSVGLQTLGLLDPKSSQSKETICFCFTALFLLWKDRTHLSDFSPGVQQFVFPECEIVGKFWIFAIDKNYSCVCVWCSALSLISGTMMMRRQFQPSGSATLPSGPSLPSLRPPGASSTSKNNTKPRSRVKGEDDYVTKEHWKSWNPEP